MCSYFVPEAVVASVGRKRLGSVVTLLRQSVVGYGRAGVASFDVLVEPMWRTPTGNITDPCRTGLRSAAHRKGSTGLSGLFGRHFPLLSSE
jgi:hypothetical protein